MQNSKKIEVNAEAFLIQIGGKESYNLIFIGQKQYTQDITQYFDYHKENLDDRAFVKRAIGHGLFAKADTKSKNVLVILKVILMNLKFKKANLYINDDFIDGFSFAQFPEKCFCIEEEHP